MKKKKKKKKKKKNKKNENNQFFQYFFLVYKPALRPLFLFSLPFFFCYFLTYYRFTVFR